MATKLRVFLADDHEVVRDGLRLLIDRQPDMEVVGEAETGREAVRRAAELRPDLVVMDVSLPDLNGGQATERLRRLRPEVKVLALTAYEDRAYLRHLLEAGAVGYVLKRSASEELVTAIRRVAGGGLYLDPALAGKVVSSYLGRGGAREGGEGKELSGREAEVLRQTAWGYSNKEIAQELGISVKTVETYKGRVMEKLELRSRAEVVRYAIRQGWLQDT